MKKLLFVFGLVFLLVGCAAPQSVETHLPLISSIPPEYFEAAHTDLVIAENFFEQGQYIMAYLQYRKAYEETYEDVAVFYYFALVAAEKQGSNNTVYRDGKYLLNRNEKVKHPLPDFYLEQLKKMINRAALTKEASR